MGLKIVSRDGKLRGWFIMLHITGFYLLALLLALFVKQVQDALLALGSLLIWFYSINIGLYAVTGKKGQSLLHGLFNRGNGNDTERGQ